MRTSYFRKKGENSVSKRRLCFRFSITSSSNVSLGVVLNSETVHGLRTIISTLERSITDHGEAHFDVSNVTTVESLQSLMK